MGKYDLINHIVSIKRHNDTSWLKQADSQALQQSILNMDKAYQNFFKKGGFPKFKSKHHSKQSFQYPQRVRIEGNKLYLPKVGLISCKGLRDDFKGKVKTVTISKEAYKYYASILIEFEAESDTIKTNNGRSIGLDVGVKNIVTDSDGNKNAPLNLERCLEKLRIRNQQLSRKKKGSKNREKAKMRLAMCHMKIVNKRKDFLHKLALSYCENQTVIVEDLKVKDMTRSSRGTKEKPGKNVSKKRQLNRKITQQSWGMLYGILKYKVGDRGGVFKKVDPKYTSQTCSSCGHVSKENRKTQSEFVCINCKFTINADVNAAKNILVRGAHGNNAFLKTKIA